MTITRDDAPKADPGLKRVSRLRARACPRLLGGGSLLKSTAGSPFTAASFVRRPALARVTRPRGDVLVAPLAPVRVWLSRPPQLCPCAAALCPANLRQ